MTYGQDADMASFLLKKKKYKFHVEICLEELLEVPFVSAVLFAKLRLLDGGNFQDHSTRQEVCDHKVHWGTSFAFPCKMMANASTGVMDRCILRISVRKESKGGRSFNKLGFVDINLAEYAGAGVTYKKALLEGYDTRHRQDNSMLKFRIELNMISGDILFKAPCPTLKSGKASFDDSTNYSRNDEYSNESLAGSVVTGTSGFASFTKKIPGQSTSDVMVVHTTSETNVPVIVSNDHVLDSQAQLLVCSSHIFPSIDQIVDTYEEIGETGHTRNSSSASQLSKASDYSSVHTHSRHSSSGDSSHIRNPSASSLITSETGSLERAKAAYERRKKVGLQESDNTVPGRVEITRVNPDDLIEELINSTNLEQHDEAAETSGLQLFIAKDGTAAVGNHEVKSQMSTGAQLFKQVVMDDR